MKTDKQFDIEHYWRMIKNRVKESFEQNYLLHKNIYSKKEPYE
jgi:hypothetical protein